MKRYFIAIIAIWALAYSAFFLFGTAGREGQDNAEGRDGSPARAMAAQEAFHHRFIAYTKGSSVHIEIAEQRRKKDKRSGRILTEDMATGVYRERKGPFPGGGPGEFRIDPAYLRGVAGARLGGGYTLLTPKGQYPMVPEGLYYLRPARGTGLVTMRLVPKNPGSSPGMKGGGESSAPPDLFVLREPHPPVRTMEVYTAQEVPLPPELMGPVKKQASRVFRKIRASRRYLSHGRASRPSPSAKFSYFTLPEKLGLKLVAVYWSALGGKGYSASALFRLREDKGGIRAVRVVDVDPYNDSVLSSKIRVLVVNDSMFAFVLNEGEHYSRQEKVYVVSPSDGPWRLCGASVLRDEGAIPRIIYAGRNR